MRNALLASTTANHEPTNPSKEEWDTLIFGVYTHVQIREAISERGWQELRISLLGMGNRFRFAQLRAWVHYLDEVDTPSFSSIEEWMWRKKVRQICVTNYVNALRRGGLIP